MKISIALCTFNGEQFLEQQLASFSKQTRSPDELVVCDDASSDTTVSVLENFAKTAPFPVSIFLNEQNLGSLKNFEQVIEKCSGDIIALSDQDDVWLPEKLKCIATVFESRPNSGLVFSNAILTDVNLKPTGWKLFDMTFRRTDKKRFRAGKAIDVFLEYNVITGAAVAFRAELRRHFLPIPQLTDFIHDGWIGLVAAISSRIEFIDTPLLLYRQHAGQQLGAGLSKWDLPIRERHRKYIANRRLALERLSELSEILPRRALPSFGASDLELQIQETRLHIQKVIEHYERRAALPDSNLKRLFPILRETFSLGYHRFSRGLGSAGMDLISK